MSGDFLVADCEDSENLSAPEISAEKFKHREVAREGTLSSPCADGSLKLFNLPRPHRGEWSADRSLEQDEKEVEETTFEDEHEKYFRSRMSDFADRHRDEQSSLR